MQGLPYLEDLARFSRVVWGNPQALLRELPSRGAWYIEFGEHIGAIQQLSAGILLHDKILIRDEYRVAVRKLQEDTYKKGACVIGQPGIGKSYFLFYALVYFLGKRQPVALQHMGGYPFYILFRNTATQHHIDDVPPLFQDELEWALSDSNVDIKYPPVAFRSSLPMGHTRLIQTTSPDTERWKEWTKQSGVSCYIMDIWTDEEVENLAIMLNLDVKRMTSLAEKWGAVPRMLLQNIDQNDELVQQSFEARINEAVVDCPSILKGVVRLDLPTSASFPFYVIHPAKNKEGKPNRQLPTVSVPTPTLCEMLARGLRGQNNIIRQQFYRALSDIPETCAAAASIYEIEFHNFMACETMKIGCQWLSQGSGNNKGILPATLQGTTNYVHCTQQELKIQTPPYYWRPSSSNFPGIDSALVMEKEVFVFQVTIGTTHKSPEAGLKALNESLSAEMKKKITWRVVYVGRGEEQARRVAAQWDGKLYFPTGEMRVPVAWSAVDPAYTA